MPVWQKYSIFNQINQYFLAIITIFYVLAEYTYVLGIVRKLPPPDFCACYTKIGLGKIYQKSFEIDFFAATYTLFCEISLLECTIFALFS